MIKISLPMPPSVNALYANIPGRGRVKSARYRTWLNAAGWELKAQKPKSVNGDYRLSIHCQRPDRRRRDLGNLEKPISDLLVAHGVVTDDSACVELHVYWAGSGRDCEIRVDAVEPVAMARAA